MSRERARGDDGAILVLALIVLMVFGLILAALLGNAGANERSTPFVKSHLKNVYAADAGVEAALQRLREDSNFCARSLSAGVDPPVHTYRQLTPGRDVDVTCKVIGSSGSVIGAAGYAAVIGSGDAKALDLSLGSAVKSITGPVFLAGGIDLSNKQLTINGGDIDQPCTSSYDLQTSVGSKVNFDSGYGFRKCQPVPTVDHVLPPEPCAVSDTACAPSLTGYDRAGVTPCRVFLPGQYTSPPTLLEGGTNYFASGVYHFAFSGSWEIKGIGADDTVVIAGGDGATTGCTADPSSSNPLPGALSLDLVTGTGATFVFSGSSFIKMSPKGALTIRARETNTSETQKLSIVALPDTSDQHDSWEAYESTNTTTILEPTSGSTTTENIGGIYYTPAADLRIDATNGTITKFLGGVVVDELSIGETPSADFLEVGVSGDAAQRKVLITSSARTTDSSDATFGGAEVKSFAVAAVSASKSISGYPVIVTSWRSSAP